VLHILVFIMNICSVTLGKISETVDHDVRHTHITQMI